MPNKKYFCRLRFLARSSPILATVDDAADSSKHGSHQTAVTIGRITGTVRPSVLCPSVCLSVRTQEQKGTETPKFV